jgi:hypothetical protein
MAIHGAVNFSREDAKRRCETRRFYLFLGPPATGQSSRACIEAGLMEGTYYGHYNWVALIKDVAKENEFEIDEPTSTFEITRDNWHSVAFRVVQNASGYLEVSQWEQGDEENEDGSYGRALYSLRSATDVIRFCNVLVASSLIRARRG